MSYSNLCQVYVGWIYAVDTLLALSVKIDPLDLKGIACTPQEFPRDCDLEIPFFKGDFFSCPNWNDLDLHP